MNRIALIHDQQVPSPLWNELRSQASLTAVCSLDGASSPQNDATAQPDIDSLLASLEPGTLVWVHTRTGLHAEYLIKALQAGFDVLCNAPLCITAAAAWQILETARYTRQMLWVMNPACSIWEQARREAGAIQRIHAWGRSAASGGKLFPDGGLLHSAFFPLVAALVALAEDPEAISGQLEQQGSDDPEQSGSIELAFSGGTGHLDWSTGAVPDGDTPPGFSIRIEGSQQQIRISGTIGMQELKLTEVSADGMTDPGVLTSLGERVRQVLNRQPVSEWDAFRALRQVEFIDRTYSRIRK